MIEREGSEQKEINQEAAENDLGESPEYLTLGAAKDLAEADSRISQFERDVLPGETGPEDPIILEFKEQAAGLKEQARQAYDKFLRKVRTAVLLSSMGSSALAAERVPEPRTAQQQTQTIENKRESGAEYISESQIWDAVEDNKKEQVYVSMIVNGERKFKFLKELGETGGGWNVDEARKLLDPGALNVEVIHTHPKAKYDRIWPGADRRVNAPLVPSELDLQNSIKTSMKEANEGWDFENVVYEPSGTWSLKADPDNPYVKRFMQLVRGSVDFSQTLKSEFSAADLAGIQGALIENPDVRAVVDTLKGKLETKNIGDKLNLAMEEYVARFPELVDNRPDVEGLGNQTATDAFNGADPGEIDAKIQEYISMAEKIGVKVKYAKRIQK